MLTGDIQNFNQETPPLYRPFVNLFGFSKRLNLSVVIPFTSRYLTIVEPGIIVSRSATVFGAFLTDSFVQYWSTKNDPLIEITTADFFASTGVLNTMEDLEELSSKITYGLRTISCKNITKYTGDVFYGYYSPYSINISLIFVQRHHGAMKYDPEYQPLYCRESFLTSSLLERLEGIVQENKRALGGQQRFDGFDAAKRKEFYQSVKNEYDTRVKDTSVYKELQNIKRDISNVQTKLNSQHGLTRIQRNACLECSNARGQNDNPVDGEPIVPQVNQTESTNAKLGSRAYTRRSHSRLVSAPRISNTFQGAPNSEERKGQMQRNQTGYQRLNEGGLVGSAFPMPRTITNIESEKYTNWFLNAEEGADVIRSAAATGLNTYARLTEEEQDNYLQVRGFGRYHELQQRPNIQWPNSKEKYSLLVDLCDSNRFLDNIPTGFSYFKISCLSCQQSSIADRQTQHNYENQNNQLISRTEGNFVQYRLIYPHDLLRLQLIDISDDLTATKLDENAIIVKDAPVLLNRMNFGRLRPTANNMDIGYLNSILYQASNTTVHHRLAMAQDLWLKEACNNISTFNPSKAFIDNIISDSWFYDAGKRKEAIANYFEVNYAYQDVALFEDYCSFCDYYGIRVPTTSTYIGETILRFNQQHKCSNQGKKNKQCLRGESAGRLEELPYIVARYALYLHTVRPAKYINPFLWNATRRPPR